MTITFRERLLLRYAYNQGLTPREVLHDRAAWRCVELAMDEARELGIEEGKFRQIDGHIAFFGKDPACKTGPSGS